MKILSKINLGSVIFGTIGMFATVTCLPFASLMAFIVGPFNEPFKLKHAHKIARVWGIILTLLSFPKFHISGIENYDSKKTYIITPNHQSSFDIFFAFYLLKGDFCFISKDTYLKWPVVGHVMTEAGYIFVKRGTTAAIKMISDAVDRLRHGRSLVLYPEGSRSTDGTIRFPKKGLVKIAEQCEDIEILPVIIDGSKDIMKTGTYKISFATDINVKFLTPFKFKDIEGDENAKLKYWHELMNNELKNIRSKD